MALALSRSSVAVSAKRCNATVQACRVPMRSPVRKLIIRASAEPTANPSNEAIAKAQAAAGEAWAWVKTKWESTADAEKPAVVAILIGVIVAQIAIGATIDVVDRIPIVNKLLQLVGLGVTAFFIYKLSTDAEERDTVKSSVAGFLEKVTGGDK